MKVLDQNFHSTSQLAIGPDAPDKVRYPRAAAIAVAKEICQALDPWCTRLIVAGSLRRRKQFVGDVEILYVPRFDAQPPTGQTDFFNASKPQFVNLGDRALNTLQFDGQIQPRKNINGSVVWGEKNKFAYHVSTGIPIDFFSATEANWWNYLVCRTGGAENNVKIAQAYQSLGCKWNPYGPGFTDEHFRIVPNESEQAVFQNCGLDYLEPWDR